MGCLSLPFRDNTGRGSSKEVRRGQSRCGASAGRGKTATGGGRSVSRGGQGASAVGSHVVDGQRIAGEKKVPPQGQGRNRQVKCEIESESETGVRVTISKGPFGA